MTLEDELLENERDLWTGGAAAYRRLVDDECLVAFAPMAGVRSREEVADSVGSGPRWRELEMEVVGVLRPTDDVAVVSYRGSAVRGEDERYHALVCSGYVRRGEGWKLAFHQQTPLEG